MPWLETSAHPADRFSLVSGVTAGGDLLIGTGESLSGPRSFFNDMWSLPLNEARPSAWRRVVADGGGPMQRRYGSAGGVDAAGRLIVSHGFSGERYDNAFAAAGVATEYSSLNAHSKPSARCLHSGGVSRSRGKLVIFGGCGSGGHGWVQSRVFSFCF
jgi:hypothetical protein